MYARYLIYIFVGAIWGCLVATVTEKYVTETKHNDPVLEYVQKSLDRDTELEYGLILNKDYTITVIDLETQERTITNSDSLGYHINKLQE